MASTLTSASANDPNRPAMGAYSVRPAPAPAPPPVVPGSIMGRAMAAPNPALAGVQQAQEADRIKRQAAVDAAAKQRAAAGAVNDQTQPGVEAARAALAGVTDPARYAAANQAREQQSQVANYYQGLLSGQNPSLAGLQRQQGQDAAIAALQAQALSNQNGMAPGLTQRNLLNAQSSLQGNLVNTAQQNAIQEARSALDASGNAANAMRGMDIGQAQGIGQQQLAGSGQYANLLQQNAGRDLQGYLANRGMDIQQDQFGRTMEFNQQQAAQQQANYQQNYDENNSWWRKYALPGLSAAGTLGAAALSGGSSLAGPAVAGAVQGGISSASNGSDALAYQRPGVYGGMVSSGAG